METCDLEAVNVIYYDGWYVHGLGTLGQKGAERVSAEVDVNTFAGRRLRHILSDCDFNHL